MTKIKPLAFLMLATVSFAGCASPTEVMESTSPTVALDTSAQLDQVRDCLIQHDPTGIQVTPFQGGYIVTQMTKGFFGPQNPVIWTARITSTDKGSHLVTFKNYAGEYYDRDVKPCLDSLPKIASN